MTEIRIRKRNRDLKACKGSRKVKRGKGDRIRKREVGDLRTEEVWGWEELKGRRKGELKRKRGMRRGV